MASTISPCQAPQTRADKKWPYHEYYVGERDKEQRKNGDGRNHWSGAEVAQTLQSKGATALMRPESLEWYTGRLLRDTMHGIGEYRRRYRGGSHLAITYEGYFYNNCKHGYGLTSYPDGRVFSGFYHKNFRWGPGVETQARRRDNVGLWRGNQLMRLTWKPDTPSVVPDLMSTPNGCDIMAKNRCVLVATKKTIGETNAALELLKQYGAQPMIAAENWPKLYPKNCTDPMSQLYNSDVFNRAYYDNEIVTLEPFNKNMMKTKAQEGSQKSNSILDNDEQLYYTWNNNDMTIHMMKHCYQHEKQLKGTNIDLASILNGPRTLFNPAAEHEIDCRAFLLACYLGNLKNIAQLINEYDVNPNVTDVQGNSGLMYAACGNQPHVVHFLVEAGAEINNYNDACCTPLGAALIYYACAELDIPPADIIKAILPIPSGTTSVETERIISEWKIYRNSSNVTPTLIKKDLDTPNTRTTKSVIGPGSKKNRSVQSISSKIIKKIDVAAPGDSKIETHVQTSDIFTEENRIYFNLVNEFDIRVNNMFMKSDKMTTVNYIFGVNDMITEIDVAETEEQKKAADKKDTKKDVPKVGKDVFKKPSQDMAAMGLEQNDSFDSKAKLKAELMEQLMATITQLLLNGANPTRVCCPQPALFIAVVAQAPDLIRSLVKYGANINEVYPQALDYTALDIAVSQPLTYKSLDVVRTLLEIGAKPDHRLRINNPDMDPNSIDLGPTLLHAVLVKQSENEADEELRHQLLELLLKYGCDPIAQYKGRSALDIAMSKSIDIFDIFIESPHTNLNVIINQSNQSILLKMFYLPFCKTIGVGERLQMLTNLLLFGADPLLKCQNDGIVYENLFVYANFILSEMDKPKAPSPAGKQEAKKSKTELKGKEKSKIGAPSVNKSVMGAKGISTDEVGDYKQALSLVTNCARLLFIRWIQAKLMKELIEVVDRYKHRHWNMILKEYKNAKRLGLWLNPIRCLEIWDILKTTKKRMYNDNKVLKHVLCITLYYFKKVKKSLRGAAISSDDKASIESEVTYIVRENKLVTKVGQVWKRPYVTPELTPVDEINKFNVCFECATPVTEGKITCNMCKLVDFCSFECMRTNIERYNCHPCSTYLKKKYFPTSEFSENDLEIV